MKFTSVKVKARPLGNLGFASARQAYPMIVKDLRLPEAQRDGVGFFWCRPWSGRLDARNLVVSAQRDKGGEEAELSGVEHVHSREGLAVTFAPGMDGERKEREGERPFGRRCHAGENVLTVTLRLREK
jgi:hypothetical protein